MAMRELMIENKFPELVEWRKQDAAIAKLKEEFGSLVVKDPKDKEGYSACREARMTVKATRVAIEKKRKELKADSLEYGRQVDGEAKRLNSLIEPLESYLQAQEDIVNNEKLRIENERVAAKAKRTEQRLVDLVSVGCLRREHEVSDLTDDEFATLLETAAGEFNAKRAKEAEEKAALERERAELEKQKAAQEAIRIEQEKQQAEQLKAQQALDAEREKLEAAKRAEEQRLADIEAEKVRAEELAKAEKEAAEKAAIAEREKVEREQREAKEAAERAEAERLEELAARPYKAKLKALAQQVLELTNPDGKHYAEVNQALIQCSDAILAIAKKR